MKPPPPDRFTRLGRALVRRPRLVASAWLLVLIASVPLAARVGTVLDAEVRLGSEVEPVRVATIESERLPSGDAGATLLVLRNRTGLDEWSAARDDAIDRIEAVPGVAEVVDVGEAGAADDSDTFLARLTFTDTNLGRSSTAIDDVRTLATTLAGVDVDVAGGIATGRELEEVSARDARRGELFGLPFSLLVLLFAFGAVVASFLPLVVAAASVTVALALIYLVGQVFPFAVYTQTIVTMLGLATGIDYALLMVNRFREELRTGRTPEDAAVVTTGTAGKAMLVSGLTVMLALSALLVPPLPYIRSVGVGTMLVLLVTMVVALTGLPPLLALLGHRVDAWRITRRTPGLRTQRFWRRRAEAILRSPFRWMLPGLIGLVLLAAPALRMQVADPGVRGLAPGTEARAVVRELERNGLGGLLASTTVLIDAGEDGFFGTRTPRRVSSFARALESHPNVASVVSPFSVAGIPRLLLFQYYVSEDVARSSEIAAIVERTVGREGRWVRLEVIPTHDLAPSEARELRSVIRSAADELEVSILLGGTAAFETAWTRALYGAFPWALLIVIVATFVLLGLGFRSILIPLKSILLNVLTVAAAYGVVTLVFQWGVGARLLGLDGPIGFIDTNVPLFVFAIVFGLSMDYEVFLVSRIYENHRAGLDDRAAVREALASTGNVISSAAAVMLAVFSVFLFSEVVLIKMLGLALFVAVALDATVVRVMLVPAVMMLAGRANWWMPRPLLRLAQRIDLSH